MPRVSVLMPAYNVEQYVGEAIESILNQTFTDFEFIIINDGSTDGTADIIRKYAKSDKRIKFIDNKKNQGLVPVLNQGLDLCRGEYIARMDSDDISLPERFARQVEYMDTNPECGVLGTAFQMFGNENTFNRINPAKVLLLDLLINGCQIAHPTVMMRKSVLDKNHLYYNPSYKHAEDYELWTRIVLYTEIHNLPDILLLYRLHNNNISVKNKKTQLDTTSLIRLNTLAVLTNNRMLANILMSMSQETITRFYLFGFIPFVRRKQYGIVKTKYYLFEKIPLIKIQNKSLYLFELFKIGKIK